MTNPRGRNEHPDPRHDETDRELYAIVAEIAAEVPGTVDLLCAAGLADEARIGEAGVSVGNEGVVAP